MSISAGIVARGLPDEHQSIVELARSIAQDQIAPRAAGWDRDHHFPRELFSELGELGLMGVTLPEALGGAAADYVAQTLVIEEIARADAGVATTLTVHAAVSALLASYGSPEQLERLFPAQATGQALCAFALTEAGAGSDAQAITTRARGRRITGTKQWCTTGSHADVFVVYARDEDADGRISAFLVDRDAPGLAVLREEDKMGIRSSSTADLAFEDTPGERLGERGGGMRMALGALGGGRICIAALSTGLAQAALDLAVGHARERRAFGRPIGAYQDISHRLAEMRTEIEAARALTYRAARLKAAGEPHVVEASQAKLFASRVARHWTGEAIQVLGGYGYSRDLPAERYYRDAKITEIYEGTSEIQRMVIARDLLGELPE